MLVSGLVGRAAVANGLYRCAGGSRQHRRSVYTQANAAPRGPSRLVSSNTCRHSAQPVPVPPILCSWLGTPCGGLSAGVRQDPGGRGGVDGGAAG